MKFTKEQEQKLIELNKKIEESKGDYKEFEKRIKAKKDYLNRIKS